MKNSLIPASFTLVMILVLPSKILIWGACPPATITTIEDKLLEYAKELLKKQDTTKYPQLEASGNFLDLSYRSVNDFKVHGTRLAAIVLKHINSSTPLPAEVHASFDYLADPRKAPAIQSTNWWEHLIGVPEKMWASIFLGRSQVNSVVKTKFIERYFTQTQMGSVWNLAKHTGQMSGGNVGPRIFLSLVVNLLEENLCNFSPEMQTVLQREVISRQPYNGDGLRHDGCLHQHNLIYRRTLNNGTQANYIYAEMYFNYGKEFLRNVARVMWILDGSIYDLGDQLELGIFASFLECQQWLYKYHLVDPSSTGRFLDAGNRVTMDNAKTGVHEPLIYFSKVNHHTTEIEAAKKRYEQLKPAPQYALIGNRHFFVSDMMAHQRMEYMSTLRLLSRRTVRPETSPRTNQNSKGYFEGDGFLTVLVSGKELGELNNEVFQVYDWARIPGVSCHYTNSIPQKETGLIRDRLDAFNDEDFVGGVSNNMEGFATMIYNRPTVELKGKKSWFFTDSVILCLGSDLTLPSTAANNEPVITTLNQVVYAGSHAAWEKNTSPVTIHTPVTQKIEETFDMSKNPRFHHDSVGYVPLRHSGEVHQELDIRRHQGAKAKDIQTYSLWLDHGRQPANAKYAYAILPGKSDVETEAFARTPTVVPLMTSKRLHAAFVSTPEKVVGAAYFVAGCLDASSFEPNFKRICVNTAALVLVKQMPPNAPNCQERPQHLSKPRSLNIRLQITVADPTHTKKRIQVNIGRWFRHSFTLPSGEYKGKSVIKCFNI